MTTIDTEILNTLCKRLFSTFSKLDPSTFPPEECQPIFDKMSKKISTMIPEMLTAKESYHYFQSVKHALEISEDRMHQIQMQLYREMMKIVETEC